MHSHRHPREGPDALPRDAAAAQGEAPSHRSRRRSDLTHIRPAQVLYGGGYKLVLSCAASEQDALASAIVHLVPRAVRAPTVGGQLAFRLVPEAHGSAGAGTERAAASQATTVSEVFALLAEQAKTLRLSDWGVSQVSLEDVFEHIIVRSQTDDPY